MGPLGFLADDRMVPKLPFLIPEITFPTRLTPVGDPHTCSGGRVPKRTRKENFMIMQILIYQL